MRPARSAISRSGTAIMRLSSSAMNRPTASATVPTATNWRSASKASCSARATPAPALFLVSSINCVTTVWTLLKRSLCWLMAILAAWSPLPW